MQDSVLCAATITWTAASVALGLRLLSQYKPKTRCDSDWWEEILSIIAFVSGPPMWVTYH